MIFTTWGPGTAAGFTVSHDGGDGLAGLAVAKEMILAHFGCVHHNSVAIAQLVPA